MSTFDFEAFERELNQATASTIVREGNPRFEIEPEPLESWLKNPEMLGRIELSDIQMRMLVHAERVLYPETYEALEWVHVRGVNDVVCAWGKGSGKDFVSRVVIGRIMYMLLCLESPQGYFGMPTTETISTMNVATAAPQAKGIWFDPFVRMLTGSRFFESRIDPKARSIEFEKNLVAISGHSNVESLEGTNSIAVVLDELAGFRGITELEKQRKLQDREPTNSAEGVYRMARSSVASRFPETGKIVSLSFTRFKNDPIDLLEKKGRMDYELVGDQSRWWVSRAPTWDVNPLRRRSEFNLQYADDPLDSQCRYECKPVASPHRFFQSLVAVRSAMGVAMLPVDQLETMPPTPTVAIGYHYGPDDDPTLPDSWQVEFDFSELKVHANLLAIHFDIGISHDLAGVAATHVEAWRDDTETAQTVSDHGVVYEETQTVRKPILQTDFVVAFEQQVGDATLGIPPSDIQIRWLRQLVHQLMARGWKVGMVTADGYQSTDTMQLLSQQGILTELFSLDRTTEGYDILKSMIMDSAVTVPWHPLLYSEMESLTKITDKKIDHQASSSKDMADAWAGSVRGAITLAESGAASNDGWTGGSFEETAKAHAHQDAVRNQMGMQMVPTMPEDDDDWRDELEHQMDYDRFSNPMSDEPVRSSDQPWDVLRG